MTAIDPVASEMAALCRSGRFLEAVDRFYAPNIVSVESVDFGLGREQRGFAAVRGKNVWWEQNNETHGVEVDGPYVGVGELANQFALRFRFDVTSRVTNERRTITEMALYTVQNGKIVREEFYYPSA